MFKKCTIAVALLAALTACSSSNDKPTAQAGSQATPPSQPASPNSPNTEGNGSATGNPSTPSSSNGSATEPSQSVQSSEGGDSGATGSLSTPSGSTGSTTPPATLIQPTASYGGSYWYWLSGGEGKGRSKHDYFTPTNHPNALLIDGQKFSLLLGRKNKEAQLGDLSFGVYYPRDKTGDYTFATGKLTAESQIPQEGEFTYKGKAFYGSSALNMWVDGTSSFTVDFANKTVNGQIHANSRTIHLLEAKIKGNKFEAKHGADGHYTGNEELIKGQFFGENASQLGGIWKKEVNREGEIAVFGATKQP
ncbi:MAG: Slam-dependent surface lipoprotein [Pasteurellaceae bacterium]|nr:Slam-dependent surface lipoprotein [Pasteurellaceae bacterium]